MLFRDELVTTWCILYMQICGCKPADPQTEFKLNYIPSIHPLAVHACPFNSRGSLELIPAHSEHWLVPSGTAYFQLKPKNYMPIYSSQTEICKTTWCFHWSYLLTGRLCVNVIHLKTGLRPRNVSRIFPLPARKQSYGRERTLRFSLQNVALSYETKLHKCNNLI